MKISRYQQPVGAVEGRGPAPLSFVISAYMDVHVCVWSEVGCGEGFSALGTARESCDRRSGVCSHGSQKCAPSPSLWLNTVSHTYNISIKNIHYTFIGQNKLWHYWTYIYWRGENEGFSPHYWQTSLSCNKREITIYDSGIYYILKRECVLLSMWD